MFDGSIAENISRFGDVDPDAEVQAAQDACVHEMILALPDGYDTVITGSRGILSPGQRQRVALARALYGRPRLLVLDEPNSNLDEEGERALGSAMATLKAVGTTILLVSHRQGALPIVDYLIILEAGRIRQQGPRDAVIAQLQAAQQQVQQAAQQQPEQPKIKAVGKPES